MQNGVLAFCVEEREGEKTESCGKSKRGRGMRDFKKYIKKKIAAREFHKSRQFGKMFSFFTPPPSGGVILKQTIFLHKRVRVSVL